MQILSGNQQKKIAWGSAEQELLQLVGQVVADHFALANNVEVSITIVDDLQIKALNHKYRGIAKPTDVLSFALREKNMVGPVDLLGEIVLSGERIAKQAREYGHSFSRELAFLTIHGFLHLLGYDHQGKEETCVMQELEEEILKKVLFS